MSFKSHHFSFPPNSLLLLPHKNQLPILNPTQPFNLLQPLFLPIIFFLLDFRSSPFEDFAEIEVGVLRYFGGVGLEFGGGVGVDWRGFGGV